MSYIAPNTVIRLLKNVPLNNTYKHTIDFLSPTEQASYFQSLTKYSFMNQSYQRLQRGLIRLYKCADDIYDCNYLMFQNTSFGTKWFYAFITGVEYISNDVSEIAFEIDVMQTWYFDHHFTTSYIERAHTTSDNLYEHFEPENLDIGDMETYTNYSGTVDWTKWTLVICTAPLGEFNYVWLTNGMMSCAEYYLCENNQSDVRDFLVNVIAESEQESIISAYLFPDAFCKKAENSHVPNYAQSAPISLDSGVINMPESIQGYKPKNNKLFSSPYTVVEVTDGCGTSQYYKPELFQWQNMDGIRFEIIGKYIGSPEIMIYPKQYRGENANYNEAYVIKDFPMMAVAVDTYRAWLAQQGAGTALNAISSGAMMVGSAMSGNAVGATMGLVGVTQAINQAIMAYNAPNKLLTTDASGVMSCLKSKRPYFKIKTITKEYAKMIDDYFSMYGYAIGTLGVPNHRARPHWTYLKLRDCMLTGSVPVNDMHKLCDIYNTGITFWRNGDEVGNYSLDNSPS